MVVVGRVLPRWPALNSSWRLSSFLARCLVLLLGCSLLVPDVLPLSLRLSPLFPLPLLQVVSKVALLAASSLTWPLWWPWAQAANKNLALKRQYRCVAPVRTHRC